MNKHQSSKLDSLKLIAKESENNPESISKVPKFGVVVDRLRQICSDIEELQIEQEKDLTGITADKGVALENLSDSSIEIAGALYSYAHDKNDNILMAKVNLKATQIANMTQSELTATAKIILEEASQVPQEELANEGISADELSAYSELINYFSSVKSSKREAVIDRSGVTEKLSKLFEEANSLVKNKLDRLAVQFKRKDPDFYLKYKAARAIQYRATPKKDAATESVEETK